MLKITLILLLINFCLSLHASNSLHLSLNLRNIHFQNTTAIQHLDQITTIKAQCEKVNKNMTAANPQKYKFLIDKTSQIQTDLSKLQQTLVKYNLAINHGSRLCPGVTKFNRTQIRMSIIQIEINQKLTVQYLSTCIDCSLVTHDILNIQNITQAYIKQINKTLDGDYCSPSKVSSEKATGIVNLNSSYFKNNLNAKNWYYGSTTASDYKIYIFQRSAKYNLTNCPLNKPFVKDQEQVCFDCPEGSIYNIGKRNCDTCKSNQILNVISGSCDQCLGQKTFIDGSLVCKLCILSKGELFNSTSGHCYTCTNNTYLDTDKLACLQINCPSNTPKFNRTTQQCSACPQSQAIDPHDASSCIKTNYVGLCNPSTPKYDTTTKNCTTCQQDTIYNSATNQCDKKQPAHQTFISNLNHQDSIICPFDKPNYNINTNQCQSCKQNQYYNSIQKRCIIKITCGSTQTLNTTTSTCIDTASTCRSNQVYILKVNRCLPISITCDQNQYYNPQTKLCIQISYNCQDDQYYNIKTKVCTPKKLRCQSNQQYNQQLKICTKLVLCKDNQYYNHKLKLCENARMKCNPQKQYFVQSTNVCVQIVYITSPYSKNLIVPPNINYQNWLKTYNEKIQLPEVRLCPNQTPYSSETGCMSCPQQKPYYNVGLNECVKCQIPTGQKYIQYCSDQLPSTNVSTTISRIKI